MAGKTRKETMAVEVDKMTPELQKQYQQDKKMVRGRFHFHEIPNGSISFVYRKYKDDPLKSWTFQDGEIYTIPLGLARHLNRDCSYPEHEHAKDEDGKSIVKIGRRVQRCSFESLEFMPEDLPEAGSRILTAEKI